MKKRKVKGILMVLVCMTVISGFTPTEAAAATWKKNDTGWWYQNDDHSWPANQWKKINGKWYYFNGSGYMVTGWKKVNGKWYYMNRTGAMTTGWQKVNGKWYYMSGSGAMQANKWIGNYYVTGSGAMATNTWIGNTYVNSNGKKTQIAQSAKWVKNSKGWWYRNSDGSWPANKWQKINNKWYHFNASGYMDANKWIGNYYVTGSGAMATSAWIGKWYVGSDGKWIPNYSSNSGGNTGGSSGTTHTHSWVTIDVPATCTDAGETYRQCASCGKKETLSTSPALGHTPGDWVVRTEPTATTEGLRVKFCTRCNQLVQSESIPVVVYEQKLTYDATLSHEVFGKINEFRVTNGKTPFIESTYVNQEIARLQAGSNVLRNYSSLESLASHGGELNGFSMTGPISHVSASEIVDLWISSNGHKATMLDTGGAYCGVAVYQYNDVSGNYWTVCMAAFGNDNYYIDNNLDPTDGIRARLDAVSDSDWDYILNPDVTQ